MQSWIANQFSAIGANPLLWIGIVSTAAIWVIIIFGTPAVVRRLPPDAFSNPEHLKPRGRNGRPWPLYIAIVLLRNLTGVALILLGTIGLQGVLVVILGLGVMDIPGKARVVQRLATIPFVWRLMERIRNKANLPPLQRPWRCEEEAR